MNTKEILEVSKVVLQLISICIIPLLAVIFSQFKGREKMMNQNKERWLRGFNNIFRFILAVLIIELLIYSDSHAARCTFDHTHCCFNVCCV